MKKSRKIFLDEALFLFTHSGPNHKRAWATALSEALGCSRKRVFAKVARTCIYAKRAYNDFGYPFLVLVLKLSENKLWIVPTLGFHPDGDLFFESEQEALTEAEILVSGE